MTEQQSRSALLVDDDPHVRFTFALVLEDLGFQVVECETPVDALHFIQENSPSDVLVTDIVMPGMDGWTFAERARESWPTIPVLYVSGFSTEDIRPVGRSRIL